MSHDSASGPSRFRPPPSRRSSTDPEPFSMTEPTKPNGGTPMTRMNRDVDDHLDRDAHESHAFDRRALVAGAAGALVAAAFGGSARAAHVTSSAGPARAEFDPVLARRLQQVLDDVISSSSG